MTAVTAETPKTEDLTLEDLRTYADRAEKRLEKFTASLADSRRRRESLMAERGSLVLPARVDKNSVAQKRLLAIDEQLSTLNRDIKDDESVLQDLTRQLNAAQENAERTEWESRRAVVRKMIETRLTGKAAATIEKAVDALATALQAAKDEDEKIRIAALDFEPRLKRDMRPMHMAGFMRSVLAAWKLQKVLPVDTREFVNGSALAERDFAFFDGMHFEELLRALDGLELVF